MKPFRRVTSRAAVLDRPNVDTDQIIPKQFLKRIERTGFGQFLFQDWRFDESGEPRPEFELNDPGVGGAKILITGENFGCGSSREHAAWALQDYGFEVLIAPSYGDIFHSNALKIGLVPVVLPAAEIEPLIAAVRSGGELTVDLESQEIESSDGARFRFDFDPFHREAILNGLDEIGRSLAHEEAIAAYEDSNAARVDTLALARG
jgi:3-isopropylmalate/(R)-2-methylmalate dehydratase small subunit